MLRPINYQRGVPGYGVYEGVTASGIPYAVANLAGASSWPHQRSV